MLDLTFEAGEVRRIEFRAKSRDPLETMVITGAEWTLRGFQSQEPLASGRAEILGDRILSLVPLTEKGRYLFELTVTIPPEVIKERIDIRVVK